MTFWTSDTISSLNRIFLEGKTSIITVELSKAEKAIAKPVDKISAQEAWAVFFRYLTDREKREKINEILKQKEGIAMASEVLINISRNEIEQARKLSELKYILDTQSMRVTAKREGRAEGHAEGRVEGHAEGIMESRFEIAKKMKKAGRSFEEITEFTSLSNDEIEKL
jgi:predicted transposase/invertase (TIGR01784 family)